MANISRRRHIADTYLGNRIERADLATVVWAAGAVNLFTITGGNIYVNLFRAEVEVDAIDASAGVPRYGMITAAPYPAATIYFSAAATTVATYPVGASLTVVGTALNTVVVGQITQGPTLIGRAAALILTPGIIIVTNAVPTTGNATTVIRHQMWWVPMDDGANVVVS